MDFLQIFLFFVLFSPIAPFGHIDRGNFSIVKIPHNVAGWIKCVGIVQFSDKIAHSFSVVNRVHAIPWQFSSINSAFFLRCAFPYFCLASAHSMERLSWVVFLGGKVSNSGRLRSGKTTQFAKKSEERLTWLCARMTIVQFVSGF